MRSVIACAAICCASRTASLAGTLLGAVLVGTLLASVLVGAIGGNGIWHSAAAPSAARKVAVAPSDSALTAPWRSAKAPIPPDRRCGATSIRRKVDPVEAELGVDHVPQRFQQILDLRADARSCAGAGLRIGARLRIWTCRGICPRAHVGVLRLRHLDSFSPGACAVAAAAIACAVASFHAIQPSSAHLIRAGYWATPTKAAASPSTSSSGSAAPRERISSTNAALMSIASPTDLPITISASTDMLAWLIEQPSAS